VSYELPAVLRRYRELVEEALRDAVGEPAAGDGGLGEAIRYSLLDGGKRIRPALLLAAGEAVGGAAADLLPFACAVEMIHCYSLIHDDLPAMDDDDLRRGRPTSHVRFGEGVAILAGDALLTEAFHVMCATAASAARPRAAIRAAAEIAAAAGVAGMVGGQAADLAAEGGTRSLAEVESIHRRKTGALIVAAVRAGALLAEADEAALARLSTYAERVGLAFQVADDVLDRVGTTAQTGKHQGRDRERGKQTYPLLLGVGAARDYARRLLAEALAELGGFDARAEPLRDLARFVVGRACGDGQP
jgi:geranylgeranyl diphosphate synthase type II